MTLYLDTVEVRSPSLLVPTIIFNEIHGLGAFLHTRDPTVLGASCRLARRDPHKYPSNERFEERIDVDRQA
jgi:hypothetical protein